MTSILFFLAPSSISAKLMATYFKTFCKCELVDVMGAYTENNDFMISAEVPDTAIDNVMNAMQSLSRITGNMFSFQTVDKEFKMYRVTMIK